MKVLLVDVNCKSGSTGKIAYDLKTYLDVSGVETAICYGRGKLIKEKNIYKFGIDIETKFHAFMTRLTGLMGYYSYFSTKRLIKFIKNFHPDVVHLHEIHSYFVNVIQLLKFLKKSKIKVIHTYHCEFMYTGKCGHAYECENWTLDNNCACGNCPYKKGYPKSLFFDRTHKMIEDKKKVFNNFNNYTIVTPSVWLAKRVEKSFLNKYPLSVINNGIDTEIFQPQQFEDLKIKHNLSNEKVVLAVAPNIMDARKGGRYVLELAKLFIDGNVKFIIIGINDLNEQFPNNVIALGRTENQIELAKYYSMADLFVICSQMENFPTTCLEAQCCGTQICGFDVGGVKETACFDQEAFIGYGDVAALKKVIINILNNPLSKLDIATKAKTNYKKEKMAEAYENLYYN